MQSFHQCKPDMRLSQFIIVIEHYFAKTLLQYAAS